MNRLQRKITLSKISQTNIALRSKFWPDVDAIQLWDRKKEVGFTTTPRTLTFIMNMQDEISKNKPLSKTYLTLWLHSYDEMVVNVKNEADLAYESGFAGQRAIITWRERMKSLSDLGFIRTAEGASGKYSYILLLDPHTVIEELYKKHKLVIEKTYNIYFERCLDIGKTLNDENKKEESSSSQS